MHAPRDSNQSGFTLLEVMIVAFLFAVIAGTVVLTVMPPRDDLSAQDAAVVFEQKMHHARETALLRNWVLGVAVGERGYTFYRWLDNEWQEQSDGALQAVELSMDMRLDFQAGDFAILDNVTDGDPEAVFRAREDENDDRNEDERLERPDILIFESTDFVPFQLAFHETGGESVWVDGNDGLHLRVRRDAP
jgi:general secretion pathway protein H